MKSVIDNQQGIALYLVLWVIALLTVIAGEFCYVIRTEVNITRNFKEQTETYYIAVAGVFQTVGELIVNDTMPRSVRDSKVKDDPKNPRWKLSADMPAVAFGKGWFKVEKENESGKVNLNRAGRPLLEMMLNRFNLDDEKKDVIVDSILDWRDRNDRNRPNGAESDYYMSLSRPYRCKNGDFSTAEELLLVRGITPEMFYGGLKDMVSVYQDDETNANNNRQRNNAADFNRININAASPVMLASLPGLTADMVEKIMEYRNKKDFDSLPELLTLVGSDAYKAISAYLTLQPSPYYTIKSTGMLSAGQTRQGVRAVVRIDRKLEKGYEVVQWIDELEYGT